MSVEDIAGITGDSPEAVARKLDEYAKNHVINGYHALVDWEKAGVPRVQAIIELRVSPRRESGFDEIAETIANFEEVDSVMLMSGGVRPCPCAERQELSGDSPVRGKAPFPAGGRCLHSHAFRASHL